MTTISKACSVALLSAVGAVSPSFLDIAAPSGNLSGAAMAANISDGGKARINLSGKLKALSQEIAAAACDISAGFDVETARGDLQRSLGDFSRIFAALEHGELILGVPTAETNEKTLWAIRNVEEIWQPIKNSADLILANGDPNAAKYIAENNLQLLDLADTLASQLSGQYSDPESLLQVDAMAIGIAGRQLTFSQRIRKEACEINHAEAQATDTASFNETIEIFDRSLQALRVGMPEAGVRPPPSEGISTALEHAASEWNTARPILENLVEVGTGTEEEIAQINEITHAMQLDMTNVVTQYLLAVPGSEDIFRIPLQSFAETQLAPWMEDASIIASLREQNAGNTDMNQGRIDALDKQWRAETEGDAQPLIDDLMSRPASVWLQEQQARTAGFVTEVFVMDNVGNNVAQSAVTSDYWQGDEAKWQETFGNGSGQIHISEVEFDTSTKVYQSQVSMPVFDPDTRELIGAVTFGVNVQSLL